MSKDQILSVQLGADLKKDWKAYCRANQTTPSDAIRQVVRRLLSKAPAATQSFDVQHEQPDTSRSRIELRLTHSERAAIEPLAALLQVSVNVWIINLIRANLTRSAQLGMAELQVLGASNSQLQAIGRNLNQIARWMNANQGSAPPDREQIEAIYQMIQKHTAQVAQVMRANVDRWVIK
jgi:hypothetical protein